jgi:hypothetical protein
VVNFDIDANGIVQMFMFKIIQPWKNKVSKCSHLETCQRSDVSPFKSWWGCWISFLQHKIWQCGSHQIKYQCCSNNFNENWSGFLPPTHGRLWKKSPIEKKTMENVVAKFIPNRLPKETCIGVKIVWNIKNLEEKIFLPLFNSNQINKDIM